MKKRIISFVNKICKICPYILMILGLISRDILFVWSGIGLAIFQEVIDIKEWIRLNTTYLYKIYQSQKPIEINPILKKEIEEKEEN